MSETITSPQNEKLKLIRRLAERRGREREGLFVAEGEDLLAAGLATGREPELVLVRGGEEQAAAGQGAEAVEPGLLDRVSVLGSGTRVVSVWPLPTVERPRGDEGPWVYLHAVADPGNVGAIARSAAGLWGARLALGPGCADPYAPKAVRAAMGSTFALPPAWAEVGETPGPRLGLVAHGGRALDAAISALAPRTLCLGSERHGLDEQVLGACAAVATIPLQPGTESLNVAASAAIALQRISSADAGAGPAIEPGSRG